ncbi:MAG: methyltransferase domain-containing protein [Candidatus Latescibacterota bacterium]|nr:MAG: methyltransferase domain-containing protein [Candidatus Latescibacterota bacterium]
MAESSDVKRFYEGFADNVLLEDFRRFNLRQDAVRRLCRRFIPNGSRVLEVGCGVGIISKYIASLGCRVVGLDLSENNIRIAEAYAGTGDCEFKVFDVIAGAAELPSFGIFDVILLPDVIEHIPKNHYPSLFEALEARLTDEGKILLTFPSPQYQRHLKAKHPDRLQVVDETVELTDITESTSLRPQYFSSCDVWEKNQYNHVVLITDRAHDPTPVEMTFLGRLRYRFSKRLWRFKNRSFLARLRRGG